MTHGLGDAPPCRSGAKVLKSDLPKAFGVINFTDATMNSVGWDFTKMAPLAQSRSAKAQSAKPALTIWTVTLSRRGLGVTGGVGRVRASSRGW